MPGFFDGGYQLDWIQSLDRTAQSDMARKMTEGSIDYPITLQDALKMSIKVKGQLHTLAWVAKHKPGRLEFEIDTQEPGSVLFQAIMLVYNANIDRVLRATQVENDRMKKAGIEGLRAYRKRTEMKVRPTGNRAPGRAHLTSEALRWMRLA